MPLTIPAAPNTPVLGSATFDNDAGANLTWQKNFADAMSNQKVLVIADIVGTVSQSGGVPTGSIIQYGTNSTGSFIRFADGTQITWQTFNTAPAPNSASGSIFVSSTEVALGFPATFIAPPVTSGNTRSSANRWVNVRPSSGTQSLVRIYSTTSSGVESIVDIVAIGRWF